MAGASIHAADLLAEGKTDVAIVWDGGRHHAHRDRAAGFCYVNDIVLAIQTLRKPRRRSKAAALNSTAPKRIDRVLYLDLDLHWGDAVEEAFFNSASVLTLSVHRHAIGFFPCTKKIVQPGDTDGSLAGSGGPGSAPGHALSLPLEAGAQDQTLATHFDTCIAPTIEAFDPDAIVLQLGADSAAGDPHGVFNYTAEAYCSTVRELLSRKTPMLVLGGGGYHIPTTAKVWAAVTKTILHPSEASGSVAINDPIPPHKYWDEYAPDSTLEVRKGDMQDENKAEHLARAQEAFKRHAEILSKHGR